jgi:hypothetical protein
MPQLPRQVEFISMDLHLVLFMALCAGLIFNPFFAPSAGELMVIFEMMAIHR